MTVAAGPTLRSIKEEMRLAIVCEWLAPGSVLKSDGSYRNGNLKLVEKNRGAEVSNETYANGIYEIKRLFAEKYGKKGFSEIVNKAEKQVNRNYIKKLLENYEIKLEETYSEKYKREDKEDKEKKLRRKITSEKTNIKRRNQAIIAYSIFTVIVIFLLLSMRSCVNSDNRTPEEKALDAYCTTMGHSGCSDTAREIRRITKGK